MGFLENLGRKAAQRDVAKERAKSERDFPDNWAVEINDVLGRWDKLEESEMRVSLGVKGVLIHQWRTDEGLKYDEIIRLLQAMLDYDIFNCTGNSRKYKGRPLRIKNLGTGDFIMLEALNLKANPVYDESAEKMDTLAQMQQWSSPKTAPPLLPPKSIGKRY